MRDIDLAIVPVRSQMEITARVEIPKAPTHPNPSQRDLCYACIKQQPPVLCIQIVIT